MAFEKIKEIQNGYINLIKEKVNLLPEDIEQLAKHRKEICDNCKDKNHTFNSCNICGCYIPAKTSSEYSSCPKNHW